MRTVTQRLFSLTLPTLTRMNLKERYGLLFVFLTLVFISLTVLMFREKEMLPGTTEKRKFIYFATQLYGGDNWQAFFHEWSTARSTECNDEYSCQLTKLPQRAHALIFHASDLSSVPPVLHRQRLKSQRWVFFSWDSINNVKVQDREYWRFQFNWTATYLRTSDIVVSFRRGYMGVSNEERMSRIKLGVYNPAEKTRFAFAVISNCSDKTRKDIFEFLGRFMRIDVFENCGSSALDAKSIIQRSRSYRYFLAFEDSTCKDYITDKFWYFGLMGNAVPVVLGGHTRNDYSSIAPPQSFVYVNDFKSIDHLVKHLNWLANNELQYARYLEWKMTFVVDDYSIYNHFMCTLCEQLHRAYSNTIRDMESYWNQTTLCHPSGLQIPLT